MRAKRPFLIRAKASLVELLQEADEFYKYIADDVILNVELSDRHGHQFTKIFEQIKESYMMSVSKNLPLLDVKRGFDFYWNFEPYTGCVTSFDEILHSIEQLKPNTSSDELNYLINLNLDSEG